MRVLFVYPNVNCQIGFNYGVASLSAVLRRAGHRTALLNLNEKLAPLPGDEAFRQSVRSFEPDLVGFSVVTTQYPYARKLARLVKECRPDLPVAMGGVHATMVPGEVLADSCTDFACVGESEESFLELVEVLDRGGDTTQLRGIWARRDGRVIANPVRPLPDLAALPPKDYGIFDFQRMIDAKSGWVGLMASRGCPYRCTYCFNHEMFQRYRTELGVSAARVGYVRHHPVDHVIDEIGRLLHTYTGIRMFIFDDDLFTHDKPYVLSFCERYPGVSDVPITVNAHVLRFDADIARALRKAGCRLVKFGIESGSARIRKHIMNRHMSNESIVRAFRTAREAGLETSAFLMVGLPTEGRAEVEETLDLLARTAPDRMRWSLFYPFPGTRAHGIAVREGCLDPARMQALQNFFEDSCLDFGPEHDLYLRKLRRTLPWEVNARSGGPAAPVYRRLVAEVEAMDEKEWETFEQGFLERDKALSEDFLRRGTPHWAIRYNEFMAVHSRSVRD